MDRELLKGYIDVIILGIVKNNRIYGYNIIKKISTVSESYLEIKEGTLYLALKRLEKKEYLSSSWDTENTYPKRKYYEITDEGISYLEERYNEINKINKITDKIIKGDELNE